MNKVFLGLILTVCILGMALVMLNDRLGRKSIPTQTVTSAESQAPRLAPEEIEANARAREIAEAARALSQGPQPVGEAAPVVETIEPSPLPDVAASEPTQIAPAQLPAPPEPTVPPAPKPAPPAPTIESQQARAPARTEPPRILPEPKQAEVTKQPAPENVAPGGRSITRFVIYARDKGATVRIGGNGKLEYSSMTLANPDRIVVDLPGGWKFPPHPGVPRNDLVSAVRVGQSGDKTRVVIDLKQAPRKVLLVPFKNGDGVDVRVDR